MLNRFNNDIIHLSYEYTNEWNKTMDDTWKVMTKNASSLDQHYPYLHPIYLDYLALNGYAIFLGRLANKMLANSQKILLLMEDTYLSLFKYNDNSYLFDIATGISIPVPDVLKIEDFNKGSPSNWK